VCSWEAVAIGGNFSRMTVAVNRNNDFGQLIPAQQREGIGRGKFAWVKQVRGPSETSLG
jgi:hypothetical protein